MCGDSAECRHHPDGLQARWVGGALGHLSRLGPGQVLTQQQLCLPGLVQHLLGRVTSSPSSLHFFHVVALGEQSSTVLKVRREAKGQEQ